MTLRAFGSGFAAFRPWSLATLMLLGSISVARADATATNFKITGETVTASFEASDPADPCLRDTVIVISGNSVEKVSPGGKKTASKQTLLIVVQEEICLGISLLNGAGTTSQHSLNIKTADSASLTATVPVADSISQQIIDFSVNLTWTATGPAVTEYHKEMFRDRDLGILVITGLRGSHAPAVATGSVVAAGSNFTPEPSTGAEIQTQNEGTLTVQTSN
jgi:hypothetical protein